MLHPAFCFSDQTVCQRLALDSIYWATGCTCAAIDASIWIDLVWCAFLDSVYWAAACASAAADASISNFVCHSGIPPIKFYNLIVT